MTFNMVAVIKSKRFQRNEQECINSSDRDGKNYSFIFRILTPSVPMIEHMITNDSINKINLQHVFSLASFEGMKPGRFSPLNDEQTQNFQNMVCIHNFFRR